MTQQTTKLNLPVYRAQTYTIAEVGDKLQGTTKVKHVVMALLPGSTSKWGDQYNVREESLWPYLTVGKQGTFILERQSLKKPEYDGAKDWHYWWGLVGLDPEYVPVSYVAWREQQPKAATPAPAAAPAGAQQPQAPARGQEGPSRDATRVSIERQVALKCATEAFSALYHAAAPEFGGAEYASAWIPQVAEAMCNWLVNGLPQEE